MEIVSRQKDGLNRYCKREYLILGIACIVVFLLHIHTVGKFYTFTIWDDEFCYWSSASYLSGMDWSSAMSTANYYSYGSSLLLLPIMLLFHTSVGMYRAALVLNGFMLTCVLPLSYSIGKQQYPGVNRLLLLFTSLCICMLPAYYIQSSMTMAESALYLAFWLILWLFYRLERSPDCWTVILLGILLPYTYMIHQRSIGIVFAAVIALMYMAWKKKVDVRKLAVFAAVCIGMFMIHAWLKPKIQSELWLNNEQMQGNDYATQLLKFKNLFQAEGILKFLRVCCGQLFYLGATTFSMAYIGFYTIGKRLYLALFSKRNSQKSGIENNNHVGIWLFIILSASATYAISCVFMHYSPTKADHVIYGRYNEVFAGVLVLFGLLDIMHNKQRMMRKMSVCAILLLATGLVAHYAIRQWGLTEYNLFCIPGFTLTRNFGDYKVMAAIIGSILGTGLMLAIAKFGKRPDRAYAVAIGLFSCFLLCSGTSLTCMAIASQTVYHSAHDVLSYIQGADTGLPIYFIRNDQPSNNSRRGHLQFMMLDQPLICVDESEGLQDGQEIIAIQRNLSSDTDETLFYMNMMGKYTLWYQNSEYRVWISTSALSLD